MDLSDQEKLKLIEEGLQAFWLQFGETDVYSDLTFDVLLDELLNYSNEKTKTNPQSVSVPRKKG